MIHIINTNSTESIDLHEYIETISATVDFKDRDNILNSSEHLRKLVNNKLFFSNFLNEELKNIETFQTDNGYSPQSFILHRDKKFIIRVNIWPPSEELKDQRLFAYDLPHDHNFDFMTAGYTGPGYESDIWEYNSSDVRGVSDEDVNIKYCGRYQLKPCDIHFYNKGVDIHTQFAPKSLSTSINLMITKEKSYDRQYIFNTNLKKIDHPIIEIGRPSCRAVLLKAAAIYGDENTLDVLHWTSSNHPCHTTRLAAKEAQEKISSRLL